MYVRKKRKTFKGFLRPSITYRRCTSLRDNLVKSHYRDPSSETSRTKGFLVVTVTHVILQILALKSNSLMGIIGIPQHMRHVIPWGLFTYYNAPARPIMLEKQVDPSALESWNIQTRPKAGIFTIPQGTISPSRIITFSLASNFCP